MPSINTLLRASRVNCSRGAPMGDSGYINDDQPMHGLCCQRVRLIDGDYGPDGTYWGYSHTGDIYAVFNGANDEWQPARGLLKLYRAKSRAEAVSKFLAQHPGYSFYR